MVGARAALARRRTRGAEVIVVVGIIAFVVGAAAGAWIVGRFDRYVEEQN